MILVGFDKINKSAFSVLRSWGMRKLRILLVTVIIIGIATVAYAIPITSIIPAPFPESASLLILGCGLIGVANIARKNVVK